MTPHGSSCRARPRYTPASPMPRSPASFMCRTPGCLAPSSSSRPRHAPKSPRTTAATHLRAPSMGSTPTRSARSWRQPSPPTRRGTPQARPFSKKVPIGCGRLSRARAMSLTRTSMKSASRPQRRSWSMKAKGASCLKSRQATLRRWCCASSTPKPARTSPKAI